MLYNPKESFWPMVISFDLYCFFFSFLLFFMSSVIGLCISLFLILVVYLEWLFDMYVESFMGEYSMEMFYSMKLCMMMVIFSECMLFFSFFWAWFHFSLAPSESVGLSWPPKGVVPFNPFSVPLLNTIILLSSGLTLTMSHKNILENSSFSGVWLWLTVVLGIIFLMLQMFEYYESLFSISDSIYGSCFFMLTGFHGFHVFVGVSVLSGCFIMSPFSSVLKSFSFISSYSSDQHISFELSAWYWHFVDVVWLFLFVSIYLWGY